MEKLSKEQLDRKIESFMERKTAQHPGEDQTDGVRAGKMWHMETHIKKVWRTFEGGPPHKPANLFK